jgi:hypothetical protein
MFTGFEKAINLFSKIHKSNPLLNCRVLHTVREITSAPKHEPIVRQTINKMAEKNDDIYYSKFNKPLGKIFNKKPKLFKVASLCSLKDVKTDYEDQECQHLLEHTEEVRI